MRRGSSCVRKSRFIVAMAMAPWRAFCSRWRGHMLRSCTRMIAVCGVIDSFSSSGVRSTFATNISNSSQQLVVDKSGNVYLAENVQGLILKFTPAGIGSTFAQLPGANTLAFDAAGNLFATSSLSPGGIFKITPNGTISTFATGAYGGLAFYNGNLYATFGIGDNEVDKFTPAGVKSVYLSGLAPLAFRTIWPSMPTEISSCRSRILTLPIFLSFRPQGFNRFSPARCDQPFSD